MDSEPCSRGILPIFYEQGPRKAGRIYGKIPPPAEQVDEESMPEPEKITIIEGPPPTFELVGDTWLFGLTEGPIPSRVAFCRVRTANGPTLVERCYRAWRQRQSIFLEFRSQDGLTQEAPIVAVRWLETSEGHVLMLWIRLEEEDIEIEFGFDFGDIDDDVDDLDDNLDFGLSL